MNKCDVCSQEWKERYQIAIQRFDRQINICIAVTVIAICSAIISIIIAALCVVKTHEFINQFEYVEETLIEQDGDGQNIAVINSERSSKHGAEN